MKQNLLVRSYDAPARVASQPAASPLRRPLKFISSTFVLLVALWLGFVPSAQASHARYGNVVWRQVGNRTIEFKLSISTRRSYFGTPVVGSTISDDNFEYGDGATYYVPFKVTTINTAQDYLFAEATFTHTYANNGDYIAQYASCCRIFDLQNNSSLSYSFSTRVNVGTTNNSPVSTLNPFVYVPTGNPAATFQIPASDPDGNALTFSLASPAEMGDANSTQPSGLAVSSAGVVTFNTVNKAANNQYNAVIKISDGKAYTLVDFIIQIVANTGNPPVFVYGAGLTPANGSTLQVLVGCPVSFSVRATDPDAGSSITLQGVGLPQGATFPSVTGASPVTSSFNYTPSAPGTTVINFSATDESNNQVLSSVTIQPIQASLAVGNPLSCTAPTTTLTASSVTGATYVITGPDGLVSSTNTATVSKPGTYSVTITSNGCVKTATAVVTGNTLVATASIVGLPSTLCQNAGPQSPTGIPSGGVFLVDGKADPSPDPANYSVGQHTVTYSYTNTSGCVSSASQVVTINPVPTVSITGLPSTLCQNAGPQSPIGLPPGGVFLVDGKVASSPDPANYSVGQHTVTYSYTNASGCANSASQVVTINPAPTAPMLVTASGQSYPAGVSSLTVTQNTGSVILTVSGCTGGTVTWAGGSATTLSVSTASTGTQTYTATCTQNGCTSPAASFSLTVIPTKVVAYSATKTDSPFSGASARVAASEPLSALSVRVLGNPVVGSHAQVEIRGAEGQTVSLKLVDLQGKAVHEQQIEQASQVEPISVPLGSGQGMLLLKVNTQSQQQQVKLLRH